MYHSITFQTIFVSIILVLVEDGLRVLLYQTAGLVEKCLNPCSCGGWSQRPYTSLK